MINQGRKRPRELKKLIGQRRKLIKSGPDSKEGREIGHIEKSGYVQGPKTTFWEQGRENRPNIREEVARERATELGLDHLRSLRRNMLFPAVRSV